ncbi:metallophosphoesterase [Panacibacter sp. DH6]|uniref:Metallophosphoesterase n=1 Tax=Panacibacter microcysteis TaxID=2793269 RepID=A0A931E9W5_9BACT|nr:metallophosphoesterase [Panacibacter microcysteis]MBG9376366.1 metallophosphoesterase [Panacibacter microcysteis]
MLRRNLLKNIALTGSALALGQPSFAAASKRVLRIAHITDVHIRPEYNAPTRFMQCLEAIKAHQPDIFLNGGDTIYAADYDHITRERVNEQWEIWNKCIASVKHYPLYSCLGNHDMWWAAPGKDDGMYGKDYVVKQLSMPGRYYSFSKNNWHFFILDSNNDPAGSLDAAQSSWFEESLHALPAGTPVLVMSHYPLLAACTHLDGGGMHTDFKYLTELFYRHRDKIKACISGHIHLQDSVVYNNLSYYCNGAMSGFWWEDGDKNSAAKYYYLQTPPGYAIIDLYADGTVVNTYHPHKY